VSATLDALAAANRELRRELNHERERLRAIQRSRWWRLHPRRLLGTIDVDGVESVEQTTAPTTTVEQSAAASPPVAGGRASTSPDDEATTTRFRHEVVARGTFTQDWVSPRFSHWAPIFDELDGRPARILEIGSFEGLSACFFLWRLPLASVTCVDPFEGITGGVPEHAGIATPELEAVFDANVALVDSSRVRKLVGDSKRRLLDLSAEGAQFELVYVDGSHLGLDVLVDAALSWDLTAPRGAIVFDDYRFDYLGDDPLLRPGQAIDAFREVVAGKHELVFANEQIALRRTG
jgi:predicted O-methyltransferase YrrM